MSGPIPAVARNDLAGRVSSEEGIGVVVNRTLITGSILSSSLDNSSSIRVEQYTKVYFPRCSLNLASLDFWVQEERAAVRTSVSDKSFT